MPKNYEEKRRSKEQASLDAALAWGKSHAPLDGEEIFEDDLNLGLDDSKTDVPVYGKIHKINPSVLSTIKRNIRGQKLFAVIYASQINGPSYLGGDGVWKIAFRQQMPTREYVVALTNSMWMVFSGGGRELRGSGEFERVAEVVRTKGGISVTMLNGEKVIFYQLGSGDALHKGFCYALASFKCSTFPSIPHQKDQIVEGHYLGGFGIEIAQGSAVQIAILKQGIVIIGSGTIAVPWDSIVGVQIGGIGAFQTGGGFFGGGFGVSGALKGIGMASVLNSLTTKTHYDCLFRIVQEDAEINLAPETTPQALELLMAAGLSYLRKKSGGEIHESSLDLNNVVSRTENKVVTPAALSSGEYKFCEECGHKLKLKAKFCSKCGSSI